MHTFADTAFVPVFDLEDLPFANISEASETCGESLECLFDVGSTGVIEVGKVALEARREFNRTLELAKSATCYPPCQNGGTCVSNGVCSCSPAFTGRRCEIGTYVMHSNLYSI